MPCVQIGYLLGIPVTSYSLDIGKAHTDFAEAKMGSRLIERTLDDAELDVLAVMSMAGVAAEAQEFEEVRFLGRQTFTFPLHRAVAPSRSPALTLVAALECLLRTDSYPASMAALHMAAPVAKV